MPYPVYPTVPHPCGPGPAWTPPPNTGSSAGLGLYLQDGNAPPFVLFDMCRGANGDFKGDFVVCGAGTRNAGSGNIKFFLPPKVDPSSVAGLEAVWLIINTYVSDNVTDPTGPEPYVLSHSSGGPTETLINGFAFWCGSTCWLNPASGPPSFPVTTYLRNRIYAWDVTTFVQGRGSGNYTISGLPNNPTMPLGTDGDRLPGCASSQGAILYAIYKYPDNANQNPRYIQAWLGAKLMANGGPWGGVGIESQAFDQQPVSLNFTGNAKITLAAGDTQTAVDGDRANVNNTNFLPSNNAFKKIGPSLSVITQNMSNIYAGDNNSVIVETSNDCISWFFFAISADETQPKANFKPVFCVSTKLRTDIDSLLNGQITVFSNVSTNPPPPNCINKGEIFPPAPFYIRIDKEILLVTSKEELGGDGPGDPTGWNVIRGAGGTTPALHDAGACVKLVMPIEAKSQMQAALARRGMPRSRPGPGRQNGGNRIQGF